MRGIKASYFRETARSSILRGLSHQALLRDKDDSSPLWKHSVEHHNARENVVESIYCVKYLYIEKELIPAVWKKVFLILVITSV